MLTDYRREVLEQENAPYCSFVVTARNDNHGGHLLDRLRIFVTGLVDQCRTHGLNAEIVLVEWNPPSDRPRLASEMTWLKGTTACPVRILEVSNEIHRTFQHSASLPLFQMIAKNAGIRRSQGQFIVATNVDIVFPDELIAYLAEQRLRDDIVYRVDRYDVASNVPIEGTVEDRLQYCKNNKLRLASRYRTKDLRRLRSRIPNPDRHIRALRYGGPRGFARECSLDVLRALRLWPFPVHSNACGDFTLMHRNRWHELLGYAELEIFSMHIDSLLCHSARAAGMKEHVLGKSMRIYHIEHSPGSGWTPEGEDKMNARLEAAGIPQLTWNQYEDWHMHMHRTQQPMIFNSNTWGLFEYELPETVLTGRDDRYRYNRGPRADVAQRHKRQLLD